ncbi:hypothetical protein, partial [Xanthomonas campestris]|uniref:hypothetical protein n=1 Tax=Xanthomonas campestris TaxID=339 RepID=UPI001C85BCBD
WPSWHYYSEDREQVLRTQTKKLRNSLGFIALQKDAALPANSLKCQKSLVIRHLTFLFFTVSSGAFAAVDRKCIG